MKVYQAILKDLPEGSGITKEEVQAMINTSLANYYKKDETYSKTGIDERLELKANKTDVYTKAEADTKFQPKEA